MEEQNDWLKAKKRHEALLIQVKKFTGISIIATLVVGPLLYFSVFAGETGKKFEEKMHGAATPEIEIAATAEVTLSEINIELPERENRKTNFKNEDLEIKLDEKTSDKEEKDKQIKTIAQNLQEEELQTFETAFREENLEMRNIMITEIKETREINETQEIIDGNPEFAQAPLGKNEMVNGYADENGNMSEEVLTKKEEIFIMNDLEIETGPSQIKNEKDASQIARTTIKKYTQTLENRDDFVILPDTSKLDKQQKPEQLVLSKLVNHNGKWYIWFDQYHEGKPVFDGGASLILTESKKLLTLTDTIKLNLPSEEDLKVGKALAKQEAKAVLNWDESYDDIEHVEQGFYDGEIAYKIEATAHNPLGTWEVYVDGVDAEILDVMSDIRMQAPDPETLPAEEDPATTEPETEDDATTEPQTLLEATVGQVLGYVFPETPEDERIQIPFRDQYVYIGDDATLETTDTDGYFENLEQDWYGLFLSGPYVTIYDDAATTNAAIVNNTPGLPFVWDEPYASPEAINAFYHTNKIRDYFYVQHGYEMNVNIPVTVNSELAEAYVGGCNSWYDNSDKSIEIGSGTNEWCGNNDTNYALSSDVIYHEYTHAITEDVGHWPYVNGSESAAISEGLSDYFATTINDDSLWGEIASPDRTRDLNNTLTYQANMGGDTHVDSLVFSGALWDLRETIGTEETDALVFNTLYQNKTHFETFMYGMIIEDDDDENFLNGTPHLIEIIQAFENHGIGPGVLNFTGLPIDPEAWSQLLADAGIEEEESDIYGAWSGTGCSWNGSILTVPAGYYCIRNLSTDTAPSNILVYGTLYINGTMTGAYGATGYMRVYSGGTVYTNVAADVAGSLIIYSTGRLYTTGVHTLSIGSYLQIQTGGDLTVRADSTLNVATDLYVYGDLFIGSTATTYDGGDVNVSDDSTIYSGGRVYAYSCSTCIDADFDTVDLLTINGGGYMNIYERSDGSAGTLTASGSSTADSTIYINGDWNVSSTKDVNLNAYNSTYEANLTVGTGGTLYARTLNIGTSTQAGGNLTNNAAMYIYGQMEIGNYGTFTNNEYFRNSYSTTAQSVTLYNGAFFTNNDRTNIYGYTYMYDDCDIRNVGEASDSYFQTNRLYMNELVAETGLGPTFVNTSNYATLDINTGSGLYNDIVMYDDAALNIYTGSDLDLYDDITMYDNSAITNTGTIYMYGSGSNRVYMDSNATISNGTADKFYIGGNASVTSPTYGELETNTAANTVTNSGDMRMYNLDINEGTVTNSTAGMFIAYGPSDIYRGTLHNAVDSDYFGIDDTLSISGLSGYVGTFDNDAASNTTLAPPAILPPSVSGLVTMNGYSLIDNSYDLSLAGGLNIAANNVDIKNDYTNSDMYIASTLTVDFDAAIDMDGTGGDLEIGGSMLFADTGSLIMGTSSNLDIGGALQLEDSSTVTNDGGVINTDGRLLMQNTPTVTNTSGTININTKTSPTDPVHYGNLDILNDYSTLTTAVTNGGTINIDNDLWINNVLPTGTDTYVDTDVRIINSGTMTISNDVTNSGNTSFYISDTTVFNDSGTLDISGDALIYNYAKLTGSSSDIDIATNLTINGSTGCEMDLTGGTLDVTGDVFLSGTGGRLKNNNGTINVTGSVETTSYAGLETTGASSDVDIGVNLTIGGSTATNTCETEVTGGTFDVVGDVEVLNDCRFVNGDATGTNYGAVTVGDDLFVATDYRETGDEHDAAYVTVNGGSMQVGDIVYLDDDGDINIVYWLSMTVLNDVLLKDVPGEDDSDPTTPFYTNGDIFIDGTGSILTLVDDLDMYSNTDIQITSNGSLIIEDTTSPVSTSTTSRAYLIDTSRILVASGTVDIDSSTTNGAGDGITYIYEDTEIINQGAFSSHVLQIGDASGNDGGFFNNGAGGVVNVTTTDPASGTFVYDGGSIVNAATATSFNVTSDLKIDTNAYSLAASSVSTSSTLTADQIQISKNGTLTIESGTVTASSTKVLSDATCTDKGNLTLTDSGTPVLNTAFLYLGDSNTIYGRPGLLENHGTVNVSNTAHMYGCPTGATVFHNYNTSSYPHLNVTGAGGLTLYENAEINNVEGDIDIDYNLNMLSAGAYLQSLHTAANIEVDGTLYLGNGGAIRNGSSLSTESPALTATTIDISSGTAAGYFENYGDVIANTLTLKGSSSFDVLFDNFANSTLTSNTLIEIGSNSILENYYVNGSRPTAKIDAELITIEGGDATNKGYLYNIGYVEADALDINAYGKMINDGDDVSTNITAKGTDTTPPNCTYQAGNEVSLLVTDGSSTGAFSVYENGSFANYDDACVDTMHIGIISTATPGGEQVGNGTDGRFHVTNTTATAAEIAAKGTFVAVSTSDFFRVGDTTTGGRLTIEGSDATTGLAQFANQSSNAINIYDLYINDNGRYSEYADLTVNNHLEISGADLSTNYGLMYIDDGTIGAGDVTVEGTTTIDKYGQLENLYNFTANDTVTVAIGGFIKSETSSPYTSWFNLNGDGVSTEGLISSGTVNMSHGVVAADIEINGGITTFGTSDDLFCMATIDDDITVNKGIFNSYSDLYVQNDVLITDTSGQGAEAFFLDGDNCENDIDGNFDIINNGEATIECELIGTYGVNLPTGTTTVGGTASTTSTLILNTSLNTENMIVGADTSGDGLVTHDVTSTGFPSPQETFKLNVENELTINSNGSFDVSGKSSYTISGATPHGGSYGGKGQVDNGDTPNDERGYYHPTNAGSFVLGEKGCNKTTCDNDSRGGGIIRVLVGNNMTNNGTIKADGFECGASGTDCDNVAGAPYGEGAGSGGSVNIIAGKLEGSGSITANGGNDTEDNSMDSAGGGGRIYISTDNNVRPANDGSFSGDFTGTALALGGESTTANRLAGTGVLAFNFLDTTINQKHGWLVVNENDRVDGTHIIDVDGSGTTTTADYTEFQDQIQTERLIAINDAKVRPEASSSPSYTTWQQCAADTDSSISIPLGTFNWNMYQTDGTFTYDTSVSQTNKCAETANPPTSVYINNSGTGAQSGSESTDSVNPVEFSDVSPAISAIYNAGQIGGTPSSKATDVHVQVADSQADLDSNSPDVCNTSLIGSLALYAWANDSNRSVDVILPYVTTSCELAVGTTYYWRTHFRYDEDGNDLTTNDNDGWGLWSETQYFKVTEGGSIDIGTCTSDAGGKDIVLDGFDLASATPENFDEENCEVLIDSTVRIGVTANKDTDGFVHESSTSQTITDMEVTDGNSTAGGIGDELDGRNAADSADMHEVGFYITPEPGVLVVGNAGNGNSEDYDDHYHHLPYTSGSPALTKELVTTPIGTAASDESFTFYLASYIHEILNDNIPWAENYDSTVTFTLTTYP